MYNNKKLNLDEIKKNISKNEKELKLYFKKYEHLYPLEHRLSHKVHIFSLKNHPLLCFLISQHSELSKHNIINLLSNKIYYQDDILSNFKLI